MSIQNDQQVVIIGAGPIGLLYAFGIQSLNPHLKITVLEKYKHYQRSHTLNMQHKQLHAFMKATHTEQHPKLVNLLKQLKKNAHIRTDKLQTIFTELALEQNVEINHEIEITQENMQSEVLNKFPQAQLIIGADGTHSITSNSLFPKDNQIKHKFDFVLQLRYEIKGAYKTEGINIIDFYQQMARHGLIANEYVGHFQDNNTPVTMQMMISEEDYNLLKKATSKNPIKFHKQNSEHANKTDPSVALPKLPFHLQQFINTYLTKKAYDITGFGQKIDESSISISVNEAPATQAKQIVGTKDNKACLLIGDAALGLSYFKGLNAGIEACAKFFTLLESPISNSFSDKKQLNEALNKYQKWFITDFSPLKVREVGRYSFWRIRSLMNWIQTVHQLKNFSSGEIQDDMEPALRDYFDYYKQDPLAPSWKPFPHRNYNPVKIGQFEHVPAEHHLKKFIKFFNDFIKPYKSNYQVIKDFSQPIFALTNLSIGLFKITHSVFSLDIHRFTDGILSSLRGIFELLTTPIAWVIKPLFRGCATLKHGGFKKIEENDHFKNIADCGLTLLNNPNINFSEQINQFKALSFSNDLHRKYEKFLKRGQKSSLLISEATLYSALRNDAVMNVEKVKDYFTLFASKEKTTKLDHSSQNSLAPNI